MDRKTAAQVKGEFIGLIDEHKNKLINPVEMLRWVWLRVFLNEMRIEDFERHLANTERVISK